MADNGRWFKLWTSSPDDPDLDNLDIADFGRWAKLGAIIKEHGEKGKITIEPPARVLCAKMQVQTFDELKMILNRLPNLTIEFDNGKLTVTFKNWIKYQEDSTVYERVKKWRNSRSVTGQEEKRGEEKRREENKPPIPPKVEDGFIAFWNTYPRKAAKSKALQAWQKINPQNGTIEKILLAIEAHKKTEQWKKDGGQFIPHAATWLNQKRWEDEMPKRSLSYEIRSGHLRVNAA